MMQVTISKSAAAKIGKILDAENGVALRVAVQGGGCSGFSYVFSIVKQTSSKDDHLFQRDGISVLVDAVSLAYMDGAELDWVDGLIGAAFRVNNPNAVAACGCGTSFDIAQ